MIEVDRLVKATLKTIPKAWFNESPNLRLIYRKKTASVVLGIVQTQDTVIELLASVTKSRENKDVAEDGLSEDVSRLTGYLISPKFYPDSLDNNLVFAAELTLADGYKVPGSFTLLTETQNRSVSIHKIRGSYISGLFTTVARNY